MSTEASNIAGWYMWLTNAQDSDFSTVEAKNNSHICHRTLVSEPLSVRRASLRSATQY